jgi:hypothetical protein
MTRPYTLSPAALAARIKGGRARMKKLGKKGRKAFAAEGRKAKLTGNSKKV